MKTCKNCGLEKSPDEFHKVYRCKDQRANSCNRCTAKRANARRDNNPEKAEVKTQERQKKVEGAPRKKQPDQKWPLLDWSQNLERKYGISAEEYAEMFKLCGGVCTICKKIDPRGLAVDHDHQTGLVRGLLCKRCNVGLGWFRDSVGLLLAGAAYLCKAKEKST